MIYETLAYCCVKVDKKAPQREREREREKDADRGRIPLSSAVEWTNSEKATDRSRGKEGEIETNCCNVFEYVSNSKRYTTIQAESTALHVDIDNKSGQVLLSIDRLTDETGGVLVER